MSMTLARLCAIPAALCALTLSLASPAPARGAAVLVEAESFADRGGWIVDQQSMDQMGSPYLMAHGMGRPVADARTTVAIPEAGTYRVWVRTREWSGYGDRSRTPGRFRVLINDGALEPEFGDWGHLWHWHDGGAVALPAGDATVTLRDLTGFNGRCDALYFTTDQEFTPPNVDPDMETFRRQALGLDGQMDDATALRAVEGFDLVVVGGGYGGMSAALAAARLGLKVALIQDRPVLGGNNSSEIRVHVNGETNLEPFPNLGATVEELRPDRQGNAQPAEVYEDDKKMDVVLAEENLSLFLSTRVNQVEMDGERIAAVIGRGVLDSRDTRFAAPLFVDATGDGAVGYLAGAEWRIGREGRDQTGESRAPERGDMLVMGSSVQWYSEEAEGQTAFPDCPWALPFTEASCQNATSGEWDWETGMNRNHITEIEHIRDHGLKAIFGNWAFQKNHSASKDQYARRQLAWVAAIAGKRESRRLMGDLILQEQDIVEKREHADAFITATWSIDLHYPMPSNSAHFPSQEFRAIFLPTHHHPYPVPYRCLYSRNVPNLFMAGRNISVTHVALGKIRVMGTIGMMGEVVAMAASLCKEHAVTPREVYSDHLDALRALALKGVGRQAD